MSRWIVITLIVFAPLSGWASPEPQGEAEAAASEASETAGSEGQAPADQGPPPKEEFLDWLQRGVFSTVHGSANWFDSLFGDERRDLDDTGGRLALRLAWTEYDHLDPKLRFRVNLDLPNVDTRYKAFLGRVDEEEYVSDSEIDEGRSNVMRDIRDDDADWLLGLDYSPLKERRKNFKVSVGVKIRSPLEPYAKVQYRNFRPLTESRALRFRQTLFWRNQYGLGTTSNFDLEQKFGLRHLLRWANRATFSEATDGVDWRTSLALYQDLHDGRAMKYELWWHGETRAPVTVREFAMRVLYRMQIWRDWFFLEIGTIAHWPRGRPEEQRERSHGILIGAEMEFGEPGR